MSQEQPKRPEDQAIENKNVSSVLGNLGGQAVTPRDAAMMLSGCPVQGEYVADQAVGQHVVNEVKEGSENPITNCSSGVDQSKITIGQALEATARASGDKSVELSDAAAIHAAETTATGVEPAQPQGVAAVATEAVTENDLAIHDEERVKLCDVLGDTTSEILADKEVTKDDARKVLVAEAGHNPGLEARPRGVTAAVTAAARLNEDS